VSGQLVNARLRLRYHLLKRAARNFLRHGA
jgi:hypothetical protein